MIAFSSCNPNAAPEIGRNQDAAVSSWIHVFDPINVGTESDPPTVKSLVEKCAAAEDWACIINADIIVKKDFRRVEDKLRWNQAQCAVSGRYEFDPDNDLYAPRLNDLGMDIFCAVPEVWKRVAQDIPDKFRLGHILWDAWLLGYWNTNYGETFYDFTPAKVIYHPKHGNRGDNSMDESLQTYPLTKLHLPPLKIY